MTLTIQAGVEVQFTQFSQLTASGRLIAIGTATQPITITGSTAQPSWWNNLRILGTDAAHPNVGSTLSYVTIADAGNYYGDLYLQYATVNIDHSTFADSGSDGIYGDTGGVANITASTFTGNAGYAVNFDDGSVDPVLANLSASGNGHNGVALGAGTLTGAHVWENSGIPYILTNDETVAVTGTLTIQPGTAVQVEEFNSLIAYGPITAMGTLTQPITITGSTAQPSWWNNLRILGTDAAHPNVGSTLSYVTIADAGNYYGDLYLQYATVNIDHSTFADSGSDGIYGDTGGVANITASTFTGNAGYAVNFDDGSVDPVLANLSASGNGHNGVAVGAGTLTGAHVWENSGIPYILTNDETIAVTGTLTIQPGTAVQVEEFNSLIAYGPITATGTSTEPITITGSTAQPSWWNNLRILGTDAAHPNVGSTLSHVTIADAGNYYGDLYLQYATVNIDHSTFAASGSDGIYGDTAGVANITHSTFVGNHGYAINFTDGSVSPVLTNLSASGNDHDGVGLGAGTLSGARTWAFSGIPYYI